MTMFVLIVGCGRVGSAVARSMLAEGHEVSVLDEDPEAIAQLEKGGEHTWVDQGGSFTVGTALEIEALEAAGIDRADAFVASTDGDNTNLVIAQIAKKRYGVKTVVVRVLDPARATWYEQQGLRTVCPTKIAIDMLDDAVREDGLVAVAHQLADLIRGEAQVFGADAGCLALGSEAGHLQARHGARRDDQLEVLGRVLEHGVQQLADAQVVIDLVEVVQDDGEVVGDGFLDLVD